MRALTEDEAMACSVQARLLEASNKASVCSSAVFIRRFMHSDVARRLDTDLLALEVSSLEGLVEAVDAEYGGAGYGSERYSEDELHWIGYLYRCWCIVLGVSSRQAYHAVGARELRALYGPYHSLDPVQAVERICEAKGFQTEELSLEQQVAIAREVIARRAARGLD